MENEELLQQILTKLDKLDTFEVKLGNLEIGMADLRGEIVKLQTDLGIVKTQTAELTEFRTEVNQKLDQVIGDVEFLKIKEYQNEKDIFHVKQYLKYSQQATG